MANDSLESDVLSQRGNTACNKSSSLPKTDAPGRRVTVSLPALIKSLGD
jgi:hypothetical protein